MPSILLSARMTFLPDSLRAEMMVSVSSAERRSAAAPSLLWAAMCEAASTRWTTASASSAPPAAEPAARAEDAGGVDQHDLGVAVHGDAAHREACRLDLLGDDRDLGPGQAVDQRGLARVRGADDGGEAGAPPGRCRVLGFGQITPSR